MTKLAEFRHPIRYAEQIGEQLWVETDGGVFLVNPADGGKRLISDCALTLQ